MILRSYQDLAITGVLDRFGKGDQRTLVEMPTGSGKTVVFAHLSKLFNDNKQGRTLILTHRQELLDQACEKIHAITGLKPDVEKAERYSAQTGFAEHKSAIVVASVQSLISGKNGDKRMNRFAPNEYGLVIIDECHHSVSESFSSVINYFCQNPKLKACGFTATADRLDGEAMGQVFQSVAYKYTLNDIIRDGYLVPIRQRRVYIDGLDFSTCRTTAGDLNQSDLEEAMTFEAPLHGVAYATIEVACGLEKDSLRDIAEDPEAEAKFAALVANNPPRKTLVFCASVAHAERMAQIISRWIKDAADVIHGGLLPDDRSEVLRAFHTGEIQFLTGVGVPLEGFDEPGVELVAMARPTKSRAVYTQAVGRGTRPATSIARQLGGLDAAEDRRELIAQSEKPVCEVLDFVGNSGRHDLVCTADILGVEYDEAVVDAARRASEVGPVDMRDALEKAQEDFEKKKRQAEEKRKKEAEARRIAMAAEEARRANLRGVANYDIQDVESPDFRTGPGILTVGDARIKLDLGEAGDGSDKVTTDQMLFLRDRAKLKERYLKRAAGLGRKTVTSLMLEVRRGWEMKLRTPNQMMLLWSCGVPKDHYKNATFEQASAMIEKLSSGGWKWREDMV